jgi:hypothetical protein
MLTLNRVFITLIVVCSMLPTGAIAQQAYALDRENDIYVINEGGGLVTKLHIDDVMNLDMVQISPSGRFLSWQALWLEPDSSYCGIEDENPNILVVMNLENDKADTLCCVMDYDWSPEDDVIALIEYTEEYHLGAGYNIFKGHTLWLYDAVQGDRENLNEIGCGEYDQLYWSEYRNTLCITCFNGQDMHYDPQSGQVLKAWGEYLIISPNGRYGFYDNIYDPASLFSIIDKKEIDLIPGSCSEFKENNVYVSVLEWGKIDDKTVLYVDSNSLEYIDCATGQMYKVIPPSPDIDPIDDLVGFRAGRPVWAKITGDKAELFYY